MKPSGYPSQKNRHVVYLLRYHQDDKDRIPWLAMEVLNAILTAPMRLAGELLLFRPIIVFGSSVAPSDLGPSTSCVLGATSCSNKTGERINFLIPRGERVRILYDSEHPARVALGAAHAKRNMSLASRCNDWCFAVQRQVSHFNSPRLWARRQRRE